MRAIVQQRYGPPEDVLRLRDVDIPSVGDEEVLVRVGASTVHADIWHTITGIPYIMRLMGSGLRRPKNPIPGMDVAGVVEAVGANVTRLAVGDEVFGPTYSELLWVNVGAFAEYAVAPQAVLAVKPENVSFEEAATVPTSGFIAMLNLRCGEFVEPGQRVLVNGAGGAVGSIAVQLARSRGARVTGVDGPEKLEMVRALGVDQVIDYTQGDFTRDGERWNLVFDVASNLSLAACRRILEPGGTHILIGHDHFGAATGRLFGSVPRVFAYFALRPLLGQLRNPNPEAEVPSVAEAMPRLAELLATGELTPVIDRVFPLAEIADAMSYLQAGGGCGRIVVTV